MHRKLQEKPKNHHTIIQVRWYYETRQSRTFLVITSHGLPKLLQQEKKQWAVSALICSKPVSVSVHKPFKSNLVNSGEQCSRFSEFSNVIQMSCFEFISFLYKINVEFNRKKISFISERTNSCASWPNFYWNFCSFLTLLVPQKAFF